MGMEYVYLPIVSEAHPQSIQQLLSLELPQTNTGDPFTQRAKTAPSMVDN